MPLLSPEQIARAARELDPVFRASPQFVAEGLAAATGTRVLVKVETLNPLRSFKGRGTDWWFRTRTEMPPRIFCASAGNFGQGVAWAARSRGVPCTVYAAQNANPLKLERMRSFGADVRLAGADFDAAKAAARHAATAEGAYYLEDGAEPAIAEGAGSIAVELLQHPERPDAVFIPLGNGALLGGMAAWLRQVSPTTRIIGVCAAGAPAMERSWRQGRTISTERTDTIADGIAVREPVPFALETLRGAVDDIVLVDEEALLRAMRLAFATLGLLVEPAGAAGLAALLEHGRAWSRGTCATVLCGGNATAEQARAWGLQPNLP